ncbi:MAG TPA: geranylgeranylglyceryl/heptaprenylglyceryl phosphate synthase [Candidatus Dormibacteraeota bacterium]|nr:geranylgeranylglyceryl/heptaprenylglyceryl phosphate synthase [Candidatus Dormibacteraeota bacterium]
MLIPCIDLQGGQAVQLVHGRRRELAVADVMGLLEKFKQYPWLHIIDLDAAMRKGANNELVHELCKRAKKKYHMKIRVGGGIRTAERAAELIALRVDQIIVGSAAFRAGRIDKIFLRRLVKQIKPAKIIIALDTIRGRITIHGWRKGLSLQPENVMEQLQPFCGGFLCTDVDREGTMSGVNLAWFQKLRFASAHPIIAAGGIKTRREIAALEKISMDAAVGMAVYKNRLR